MSISPKQVGWSSEQMLLQTIARQVERLAAVISSSGGGGATTLGALTDVSLTAPAIGDVLAYNGSVWVNVPASSGSTSISVGATPVLGGVSGRIAFNSASVYGESANLFWDNAGVALNIGAGKFILNATTQKFIGATSTSPSGTQTFTWGDANINKGTFGSAMFGELSEIDVNVGSGFNAGERNYINAYGGHTAGRGVRASGQYSWAGGWYSTFSLDAKTNLKAVQVFGNGSFGFYEADQFQVDNHGVLAASSAALGGTNPNIPADSPRTVVLGGLNIKARAGVPDQVYVPNFNIFNVPANDNALTQVLVRDPVTGQVKYRASTTIGGAGDMLLASAQTSTGKKTFQSDAVFAGLNLGPTIVVTPSTGADGDLWRGADGGITFRNNTFNYQVLYSIKTALTGALYAQNAGFDGLVTPSSLIAAANSGLDLGGSATAGATRTITAAGSAADVSLILAVKGAGKVGIGTSSPAQPLTVESATASGIISINQSTPTGNPAIIWNQNNVEKGRIQYLNAAGALLIRSSTNDLVFDTGLLERFRINVNGAWGIGAPASYGTAGQVFTSQGNAAPPTWATSAAAVAGATGQVQFNNAGAFGATNNFQWVNATSSLKLSSSDAGGLGLDINNTAVSPYMSFSFNNVRLGYIQAATGQGMVLGADGATSIALVTNGLGRLYIKPTGEVGIGTTAPQAVLDLGDGTSGRALSWGGIHNIYTGWSSGSLISAFALKDGGVAFTYKSTTAANVGKSLVFQDPDGSIQFYVNAASSVPVGNNFVPTERMRISSNGNVGIGTATPTAPLDLVASSANALAFVIRARSTNDFADVSFRDFTGVESLTGISLQRTAANTGVMLFYTNNGGALTERMRIAASGNVGIANNNPTSTLHVNGTLDIDTGTTANLVTSYFTRSSGDTNFRLGFRNGSANGSGNGETGVITFDYVSSATNLARIGFFRGGGVDASAINFSLNGAEKFRIASTGDLTVKGTNISLDSTAVPAVNARFFLTSTIGTWEFGNGNGGNGTSANQFYIYSVSDTAYRFSIQRGTGNVGIGTPSPTSKLTVVGGLMLLDNTGSSSDAYLTIKSNQGGANWAVGVDGGGTGGEFFIYDNLAGAYRFSIQKTTGVTAIGILAGSGTTTVTANAQGVLGRSAATAGDPAIIATGTNAYSFNVPDGFVLYDGFRRVINFTNANGPGPVTFNYNATGIFNVVRADGTAVPNGYIKANSVWLVMYLAGQWRLLGGN